MLLLREREIAEIDVPFGMSPNSFSTSWISFKVPMKQNFRFEIHTSKVLDPYNENWRFFFQIWAILLEKCPRDWVEF